MRAALGAAALALFLALSIVPALAEGEASGTESYGESGEKPEADRVVARALFEEALETSGLNDWQTASSCLEEAAIKDPTDSDILYLSALASAKLEESLDPAIGKLDAALAAGRFSSYSRGDASLLKAVLLTRERRWNEALDALGPPSPEAYADPAYALARARVLALSGREKAFESELTAALRRFPDDPAFPRLFLSRKDKAPGSDEARAICETILGRLARYATLDPELPLLAAPLMQSIATQRNAVSAFRAAELSSSTATLRALEYGMIDEAKASSEMLSGAFPLTLADLRSLFGLAGSPAGRETLLSALAAWSGEVLVDSDSDGIFEARFTLAKGLVSRWQFDSHQNGEIDETADFFDGLPLRLEISRGDVRVEAEYSTYPALSSLTFNSPPSASPKEGKVSEKCRYSFAPEACSFAPLLMTVFAGSGAGAIFFPHPSPSVSLPNERAALASALSVETSAGGERRVVTLEKGQPLASTSYDGGRIVSKTRYQKGRPVLETVDRDGDGRFETERGFMRGADGSWTIAWSRIDADGDGVFEYREENSFPFKKEWDFDGNGSVDARQETLADGSIREEFSSRLDGHLDETLVVKDGKIKSLARRGVSLPLRRDSNPSLTWIGKKLFDLGGNLPEGEGVFSYMGNRYILTRVEKMVFAELVP
jgi:hypothetical protein